MQRVPEAEVLAPEQGQEQLVLLLGAVLGDAGQELLEVRALRVTQHLLPRREADHLEEDLGLERGEAGGKSPRESGFSVLCV